MGPPCRRLAVLRRCVGPQPFHSKGGVFRLRHRVEPREASKGHRRPANAATIRQQTRRTTTAAAGNSRLATADGKHRAFIDPRCVHLIEDLEMRSYKPDTMECRRTRAARARERCLVLSDIPHLAHQVQRRRRGQDQRHRPGPAAAGAGRQPGGPGRNGMVEQEKGLGPRDSGLGAKLGDSPPAPAPIPQSLFRGCGPSRPTWHSWTRCPSARRRSAGRRA